MDAQVAERLRKASGGRAVTIRETPSAPLSRDFRVCYDDDCGYIVEFTEAGCFEEAIRFCERWISRDVARREGIFRPPPADFLDFTDEPQYWMLERHADRLFADLDDALRRHADFMSNEMYYMPRGGEVVLEQRVAALLGLQSHFDGARAEIRKAVLSPQTVLVLQDAGILPKSPPRDPS